MPAITIYTLDEARQTILKRAPLDEFPLSERVQTRIREIFGQDWTPEQVVRHILNDVRARGDAALVEWTRRIDRVELDANRLAVSQDEICKAYEQVDPALVGAMKLAAQRIEAFHRRQPITSWIDTRPEGILGQMITPLARVGVYGPAGSAPLPSSILMSAIPARVAGVTDLIVCTPPVSAQGDISPLIAVAADIAGIRHVYRVGGAQAVAAMAYGTATIQPVDKIVGPGNLFVVLAKRAVFGVVGIESIPGPTETLVIADSSANPAWAAADLLAQAEHDVLASAVLLTPDADLARRVQAEVEAQITTLSRAGIVTESLRHKGGIVLVSDLAEAVAVANAYAAEHLCLLVENPWSWVGQIKNAGGIFLGEYSFEVLGDYVAGPSHVMPTGGTARFASPLNVLDFVKIVSLVGLERQAAADLSRSAAAFAAAEQLTAHAAAARFRAEQA